MQKFPESAICQRGQFSFKLPFFTVDEIEFDIDPREVKDERDLEELFDFLRRLCRISNKQTVLTPENAPDLWIFRFNPGINEPEYQTS
jgi:hypothetical protein